MKIDFDSVDACFKKSVFQLFGEDVILITPGQNEIPWNTKNKIFRSSLWNKDGDLISASFPKFMNWGEKPTEFPPPTDLRDCKFIEKLDGSAFIVSCYKGNVIFRTRGTIDASKLETGDEVEMFKKLHPQVIDFIEMSEDVSLIFEWYSPKNRIVIQYDDKPEWTLIGAINHDDYSLCTQNELDALAYNLDLIRPKVYDYNHLSGQEFLNLVKEIKGNEGVCVYHNNDQEIHKVKSDWYLIRHRMKSYFDSFDKILDYYADENFPDIEEFKRKVLNLTDFETLNEVEPWICKCVNAKNQVDAILASDKEFVQNNVLILGDPKNKDIRKKQVEIIKAAYPSGYFSVIFALLDGKEVDKKTFKNLIVKYI